MYDLTIRKVVEEVIAGRVRIPAFQRGFVWDADMVAYLMDSLYKGYPIGAILLWRTRTPLRVEKALGPFELPKRDPDYPIDYVLDGQQRITSIFGVFQTEVEGRAGEDTSDFDIYFDFLADPNAQESQFQPLLATDVDPTRHFPLRTLFDSVQYRQATQALKDEAVLRRIDEMQARFKEVTLPVQTFETDDKSEVAIVFERVNRLGVELLSPEKLGRVTVVRYHG